MQKRLRPDMTDKRTRPQTISKETQVVDTSPSLGVVVSEFHNYSTTELLSSDSEGPSPDAKKGKMEPQLTLLEMQNNILAQIKECHDDLARRIGENKVAIQSNQNAIEELKENSEFLHKEIQDTKTRTTKIEVTTSQNEKRIAELEEKINAMERQQRRINLRLHGLPEVEGENLKRKLTDICRSVAPLRFPAMGDSRAGGIDICHRVGPRRTEGNRPRPVIIRFATREARDDVWEKSKKADVLKERHLRFSEDLTARDKESRAELWPQVDEARKAGKRAYFVGARAFIDGTEIKSKR